MKRLSTLLIAVLSILVLTGCTANRYDKGGDAMEDKGDAMEDKMEESMELEGFPIDIPADQADPAFRDGLDDAFEALKQLEG